MVLNRFKSVNFKFVRQSFAEAKVWDELKFIKESIRSGVNCLTENILVAVGLIFNWSLAFCGGNT